MNENKLEVEFLKKMYIVAAVLNFAKREIVDSVDPVISETCKDLLTSVNIKEFDEKYKDDDVVDSIEKSAVESALMEMIEAYDNYNGREVIEETVQ